MKKLLFLFLLISVVRFTYAQKIKYAVKGEMNFLETWLSDKIDQSTLFESTTITLLPISR